MFVLSKLFWAVAAPGNLLMLVAAVGAARLWRSHRRRGFRLVAAASLALLAIAILPVGQWALMPLELRFPVPPLPAQVDGIIVLGGAVEPQISRDHGQVALNDAAERLVEGLVLLRRYPQAKLLLSGGDPKLSRRGAGEAATARTLFLALGIAADRIIVEDRSRNTYENALYGRDLVKPQPGQVWLLVTSAAHMPRAVGCFRRLGWEVTPYPVDFRTEAHPWPGFSLLEHLADLDVAMKEWIGLVAYRLLGRTDVLLPGP
jgi:uncharacterized SAM-binding protein YcdF (DUF218 family)